MKSTAPIMEKYSSIWLIFLASSMSPSVILASSIDHLRINPSEKRAAIMNMIMGKQKLTYFLILRFIFFLWGKKVLMLRVKYIQLAIFMTPAIERNIRPPYVVNPPVQ